MDQEKEVESEIISNQEKNEDPILRRNFKSAELMIARATPEKQGVIFVDLIKQLNKKTEIDNKAAQFSKEFELKERKDAREERLLVLKEKEFERELSHKEKIESMKAEAEVKVLEAEVKVLEAKASAIHRGLLTTKDLVTEDEGRKVDLVERPI